MIGLGKAGFARALCALAAWLIPAAAPALEPEQAAQRSASVFRVQTEDSQGRTTSGTAVLVAARTLVTSCHVVLAARDITVVDAGQSHRAVLVRADVERDLCLLESPSVDAPLAPLGDTARLHPGEFIAAAGYSTESAVTWSTGRIEGLYSYRGRGRVIQGSAPFDAGSSGGGLFDGSGRLIGILTFKARAGGAFHFAVPVEWIADLLANAVDAPRNGAGSAFWKYTDSRQPIFLRAASLAARGDCAALEEVAGQWLRREPDSPEAGLAARNVRQCRAHAARNGG